MSWSPGRRESVPNVLLALLRGGGGLGFRGLGLPGAQDSVGRPSGTDFVGGLPS